MLTIWPSSTGGVDALQEADVLVGDEHVDEAAQLARVVEEPLGEAGVRGVERLQHLGDRAGLDRTSAAPPERLRSCVGMRTVTAMLIYDSSMSNAAWNASSVGAIVAVGPTSSATPPRSSSDRDR